MAPNSESVTSRKQYQRLERPFFVRDAVTEIAQALLGKILVTAIAGQPCAARIVETEAYRAPDDQACHAANNRRTPRTETMFKTGGHAYVYLVYGMHHLFNVVTAREGVAHAVLIRAVEPHSGLTTMLKRRGYTSVKPQLTAGPGVLSQALGICRQHDGIDLCAPQSPIWLADDGWHTSPEMIQTGTRVGVDYAGADALRPWRFSLRNHPWVSKAKGSTGASRNLPKGTAR